MKLNRFLVFYGAKYYPRGGWGDFQASFDTLEEAVTFKDKAIEGDIDLGTNN